jgi:hypothetical protein
LVRSIGALDCGLQPARHLGTLIAISLFPFGRKREVERPPDVLRRVTFGRRVPKVIVEPSFRWSKQLAAQLTGAVMISRAGSSYDDDRYLAGRS